MRLKPLTDYLLPLYTYWHGRPTQKPTVYLRMTPLCNLRCTICDEWRYEVHQDRHQKELQLSTAEYRRLIGSLAQYRIERLQFGGGEALLRKDTTDLIQFARQKGLTTRILTNGVLLANEDTAKALARGIDEVWLSVDSPEAGTHDHIRGVPGTFRKVMQGIDNLNALRFAAGARHFKICVATHFSPHNLFEPQELIDLLHRKRVDFMLCTPTYDGTYGRTHFTTNISSDADREALIAMIRKVRRAIYHSKVPVQTNPISLDIAEAYYRAPSTVGRFNCVIGGYDLSFIETDGEVYPCTAYPESMGNIRAAGFDFERLWRSERAQSVRGKIKKLECGGCFHLQTQKNHLYSLKVLAQHAAELPRVFLHLMRTHNLSAPVNRRTELATERVRRGTDHERAAADR